MNVLIVTRHPALVEVLKEDFNVMGEVLSHVQDPSVLKGSHVYGNLPLHLAAKCSQVTTLPLRVPSDLRGVELSASQLREYMGALETFRVEKL